MTPDYVRRHLQNNGWHLDGRTHVWTHPKLNRSRDLGDNAVNNFPQQCYDSAEKGMLQAGLPIAATQAQPTITFNPNAGLSPLVSSNAIGLKAGGSLASALTWSPQEVRDFLKMNSWTLQHGAWILHNGTTGWTIDDRYVDTNPDECYNDAYKHMQIGNYFILSPSKASLPPQTITFRAGGLTTSPAQISMDRAYALRDQAAAAFNKCECGAAKCNTTHAHWCPLYRRYK